jgi:hypothetical protein
MDSGKSLTYDPTMTKIDFPNLDPLSDERTTEVERRSVALELDGWVIPGEIKADGGNLIWRRSPADRPVSAKSGLLLAFANLADGGPESILRFARRWGVLELCAHGFPASHNHTNRPPGEWCHAIRREPLARWRLYARRARAVLTIAMGLDRDEQDRRGLAAAWQALPDWGGDEWDPAKQSAALDRFNLGNEVKTTWLMHGGVKPGIGWRDDELRIVLRGFGLYGALAAQLALAVGKAGELYECSGCDQLYGRDPEGRRPQKGRRNYCPACRARGLPVRDAARDYRQTEKYRQNQQRCNAGRPKR